MGKVNVIIVDATGNKEQKVGLPDDVKIGIIMVKLVEKIKLPSTGPDGNPISYKFIHKVSGRQLLETQTLADAHIKDGDVLRLQPEITAGAVCTKCGKTMQDGVAFCTDCGQSMNIVQQPNFVQPNYGVYQVNTSNKSTPVKVLGIISSVIHFLATFIFLMVAFDCYDFEDAAPYLMFAFFFCAQGFLTLAMTIYMSDRIKK